MPQAPPLSVTLVSNNSDTATAQTPATNFMMLLLVAWVWLMASIVPPSLTVVKLKTSPASCRQWDVSRASVGHQLNTGSSRCVGSGCTAVCENREMWPKSTHRPSHGRISTGQSQNLDSKKYWSHSTVVSRGGIRGMRTYKNAVHRGPCHSSALKYVTANPGPYTTVFCFYYTDWARGSASSNSALSLQFLTRLPQHSDTSIDLTWNFLKAIERTWHFTFNAEIAMTSWNWMLFPGQVVGLTMYHGRLALPLFSTHIIISFWTHHFSAWPCSEYWVREIRDKTVLLGPPWKITHI